jgi:predicted Zn-dependent protease
MASLRSRILLATLGLIGTLVALGCATNPVTGRHEFSLVTPAQELEIGREGYTAVLKEYGAYDDPKLAAYVDSIGQSLAKVSHRPDLTWHFTVLDDPTVNAFAMPGGYIYITRGILAHLNSEAQLAGVLGHEIGHVTARHTATQITQQEVAGLGLGIASIASEKFREYGTLAQQGLNLLFLKYSRGDETQADELGVQYALKAGYDPREIPSTYAMLKRVSDRSGQRLPTYLSTHPDPGDRENRTRTLATQAVGAQTGLAIRSRVYVNHLEGVVFGNDPRHGYFDGGNFYHPELGFEMKFPDGWKTQNGRDAVQAAEPQNQASMQLALADAGELSPAGFVAQLQSAGKIMSADGRSENVGGFSSWIGDLQVQSQSGTAVLAAAFIRKSDKLMFQVLGQSAAPGDANEARVLASARSFRGLTDPSRINVKPDRVRVVAAPKSGTFQEVVAGFGPLAVSPEDASILNNLQLDEDVMKGQSLKIVQPAAR